MNLSSYHNQHLKQARRVRDGKEPDLILVEGIRLAGECVASGLALEMAFVLRPEDAPSDDLVARLRAHGCPVHEVDDKLLSSLSDTVTSQGIVVIARRPKHSLEGLLRGTEARPHLLVALERIQDPGNAGTIVRTAEAAGATGLVASAGTVDLFSPKALRASMGSSFRFPIVTGVSIPELLGAASQRGLLVAGSAAEGEKVYSEHDWKKSVILLLGNEASGLSADILARCDTVVRIPLTRPVESLNVASAAAALLFEAARQRRGV